MTISELADPGNYYFWIVTLTITLSILFILKSKIQMLMTITSFAYPNAKFNAAGNDYIRKAELEALIEARSFQDAAGILGTHNYPLKETRHTDEAEAILDEHNIKSMEEIMQDIPKGLHPLIKSYLKKYEVGVIKRVLKYQLSTKRTPGRRSKAVGLGRTGAAREQNQSTGIRPVGELTSELIQQMQDSERADEIADLFANTPFGKELREAIHEYDGNFQRIENILDKYVFDELRGVDEKVSKTMAVPTKVFVDHLLDISNIKLLLRAKRKGYTSETCKNMLYPSGMVLSAWKLEQMSEASNVPELVAELEGTKYYPVIKDLISEYEKTHAVSPLEIALDKYLLRLVVEIAIQHTTTAGPTIRYMVSKEFENRNLKTILHGLEEGLGYKRIMPLVITQEED